MDLFNHLLGSEGCNVDGTVGSNPFTSLVDNVFENQFSSMPGYQSSSDGGVYFVEESAGNNGGMNISQSTDTAGFWEQQSALHQQTSNYGMPMFPPAPMMYPNHFMNPYSMQMTYSDHIAAYDDDGEYEDYDEGYNTKYDYTGEETQEYEQENIAEIVTAHDDQITSEGPSQQGYDNAWDDLKSRLESGTVTGVAEKHSYQFIPAEQNPYVAAEETHRDLSKLMEEGMRLYREGKIKQAILCFESIVQDSAGAENDEAWRMLGACHAENDEDKRAIHCLNTALDCDPYNLEALLALGTSYVNELNSVKALETLRTWVSHNPRYQGLEITVDEYSDGTLMDEVMQLMVSVAAHDPLDADVQVMLGVLYNVSLDYDSAIACFSKACEMRPNDYALVNKLAASYANSNQCEQAIPYYSQALQLRPNFARGWLNLGISFANLDKFEDAAKAYLQALNLNPGARHIWSYVRVVLSCMDRFDLVTVSGTEDIAQLAKSLNLELIQAE